MNSLNLKQDALHDASARIARSIVEISEIQSDVKFTDPLAASRLVKETNRLKIALKDVEKLRLLGTKPQVNLDSGDSSKTCHSLSSLSSKTLRQIQYEVAKIEILEMMCSIANKKPTNQTISRLFKNFNWF